MKSIYTTFRCKRCRKHNITLTEETDSLGRTIAILDFKYAIDRNTKVIQEEVEKAIKKLNRQQRIQEFQQR